jgi:hypothetical protein
LAIVSLLVALAPSVAAADDAAAVDAGRIDLVVLSRDGAVQRVGAGGEARPLGRFAQPRALAALPGGRVAVLAGGKLELFDGKDWRAAPGDYADALELAACGERVYLAAPARVDELELRTGKRRLVRDGARFHLLCGGEQLLLERGGEIEPASGGAHGRAWRVPGRHPRALAAHGDKIYAATREGPLWELAPLGAAPRDLGMGGWWGTLALAADGSGLYAVTQAGKLWHIDPEHSVKTIIAMSGWEAALALAVSR